MPSQCWAFRGLCIWISAVRIEAARAGTAGVVPSFKHSAWAAKGKGGASPRIRAWHSWPGKVGGAQAPPAPPRSASPTFPQLTSWGPPTCLSHACNAPPLTSPKLVTCDSRLRPSPRGQRLGPSSKSYPFSLNGNGGSRSCSRAVRGPNDGELPLRLRGGFPWDPSRTPRRGLGSETFGPRDPALRRAGGAGNRMPSPQGFCGCTEGLQVPGSSGCGGGVRSEPADRGATGNTGPDARRPLCSSGRGFQDSEVKGAGVV